ncbi:MAG: hypothetical protein ACRDHW_10965, partial [Ktedonobacteraceae bacterium]
MLWCKETQGLRPQAPVSLLYGVPLDASCLKAAHALPSRLTMHAAFRAPIRADVRALRDAFTFSTGFPSGFSSQRRRSAVAASLVFALGIGGQNRYTNLHFIFPLWFSNGIAFDCPARKPHTRRYFPPPDRHSTMPLCAHERSA